MALYTKHQIGQLYEKYQKIEVTFNKKVIEYTRILPHEVSFNVGNDKYNCILNSSSMVGAHVIMMATKIVFEKILDNNNWVSLRLAFKREKSAMPLGFFIKSKVKSYKPLGGKSKNLYMFTIEFNQKPPEDFIQILGSLIDAGANNKKRAQDRININNESMESLHIESSNGIIFVNKKNIPCIIREVSLSGCKIIAKGRAQEYEKQKTVFALKLKDEKDYIKIPGLIVRTESIEKNDSFITLGIQFAQDHIPGIYTRFLNAYLAKA